MALAVDVVRYLLVWRQSVMSKQFQCLIVHMPFQEVEALIGMVSVGRRKNDLKG